MTDEEIAQSMSYMTDEHMLLSVPPLRGDIGVLALGHGYGDIGNRQFIDAFRGMAGRRPTAIALGMAMMSSANIQNAITALENAGCRFIVVIPAEIGEPTDLTRQWRYILGLESTAGYLEVPPVTTRARVIVTSTITENPLLTRILADFVLQVSKRTSSEVAILIAHGPISADENRQAIGALRGHAVALKARLGLSAVIPMTLQDDAAKVVRARNVAAIRESVMSAMSAGHRVLVVPVLVTGRGLISMKIRRDLAGLDYVMVDSGLAEHPLFQVWLEETVSDMKRTQLDSG